MASFIAHTTKLHVLLFPDGTYQSKRKHNYVHVSSISSNGSDDHNCLIQPEKTSCSTLKFVLNSIISKQMLWIDTVFIDNYRATNQEVIKLPHIIPSTGRNITVTCSGPCHLETDLIISADSFHRSLVIKIENVSFSHSKIAVGNMHVKFKNIQFSDSILTDWTEAEDRFGHLIMHLSNTTFFGHILENKLFGLVFQRTFSAAITFTDCILYNATTQLNISFAIFQSRDSSFFSSNVCLYIDMFCSASFKSTSFTGHRHTEILTVEIASIKLTLFMTGAVMKSNSGGFKITKKESRLLDSWLQVDIQRCTFENNRKLGLGGALEIYFFPLEQSSSEISSFVKIQSSTFQENHVERKGSTVSQGGAISIEGLTADKTCIAFYVHIETSNFINNQASDGGGALYFADSCIITTIQNSTFEITDHHFDSPKGIFVLSFSEISVDSSVFVRTFKETSLSSPTLVELQMLSQRAKINQISITLHCAAWHKPTMETEFINTQAKEITITSTSCSATFYVLSDGKFEIHYSPGNTTVNLHGKSTDSKDFGCEPCPAGANCLGNDFTAKPNFWGFASGNQIVMHQCPADYCCTVNCTGYNQCSSHRTGVLCGSCEENYSLSMLSSECIAIETCEIIGCGPWWY